MSLELAGVGLIAVTLSFLVTARLKSTSRMLDYPNARSLHQTPTPRTGGVAIVCSWLLATAVAVQVLGPAHSFSTVFPLWVLTAAIGAVSLVDDKRGLSPALRFSAQAVIATSWVLWTGNSVDQLGLPGVMRIPLGPFAVPFTVVFIIWMCNLFNFMDGMDGLAGGMATFGFGFVGLLAFLAGNWLIGSLSILIVPAALGFLWFNLPPARIFMGDVGSIPLGFLLGSLSVWGVHDGLFELYIPVVVFSPFIVDATTTLIRRAIQRQQVWKAHGEHCYQRLIVSGWSQRKMLSVECGLMLASGLLGWYIWSAPTFAKLAGLFAWFVTSVFLLAAVERTTVNVD